MLATKMRIKTFCYGPFKTNCFVFSKNGITNIIDPGYEPKILTEYVELLGDKVINIFITHGHMDHVCAIYDLNRLLPINAIFINSLEKKNIEDCRIFSPLLLKQHFKQFSYDNVTWFNEGSTDLTEDISYHHAPGHTQGSSLFVVAEHNLIFSGDSFLACFIKPKSFSEDEIAILKNQCGKKYPGFLVYPGHGMPFII